MDEYKDESGLNEEPLEILATRRDVTGTKAVQIHEYHGDGEVEYVKVSYDGEVRNLLLHSTVYPYGESPYNQEIESVPYIVIQNDVYEISSFISVGYNDEEYRKIESKQ